jgi:DNA-binding NtrC family response regulator
MLAGAPNKAKILLVDDEQDITTVLKQNLEEVHGYFVHASNKPERALFDFKPGFYDAILLDIRMPNMSGFELARAIWEKDPDARICFMTAFEIYEGEAKKVFKDFKQHCFLKKPIHAKALVEHIEKHLLNAQVHNPR